MCLRVFRVLSMALLLAGQGWAQEGSVASLREGSVWVTPDNIVRMPFGTRRLVRLPGVPARDVPVLGDKLRGPAYDLLRRLYAEGKAAGNHGDFYENRDRGHSRLGPRAHPQMTPITYAPEVRSLGYGLALDLQFDAPVLGNSSTALTGGRFWRSLPRMALTSRGDVGPSALFQNYVAGQIHVYPEHRDNDPNRGDVIPANTPYYLISQGSSGSDQPHLQAVAMILAGFSPETKARLRETGLLGPTVQMVYRRARRNVLSRAAYLSGVAHPTVFRDETIDLAGMVVLANAIAPGDIPPVVRLDMVEEDMAREGIDFYGEGMREQLFDTPSAIARVWRSRAGRRVMTVSAAQTRDPNGRPLSFTWAVLRGDPARTRIEPLTPDGSQARITVDWQGPRPVSGQPKVLSQRVDIGVFAHNGVYDSAPAFVSILLPRHETRVYEPGPDGVPRPVSIDWRARPDSYADPLLFPEIPWRDTYHYDTAGRLTGWTRMRKGEETAFDASGVPVTGGRAHYLPVRGKDGVTRLEVRTVSE